MQNRPAATARHWTRCLFALSCAIVGVANAAAQDDSAGDDDRAWEQRRNRRIAPFRRDSVSVLALVQPLMADAQRATLTVVRDGQPVALGIVVDERGYVVTKASQLDRTADLAVRMADGSQYTARWVAERKANDLALLQIEREQTDPLPVAVFADIALPPVGSFLISAGPSGAAIGLGTVGVAPRPVAEFGVLGIQIFDSERGPTIGTVLPDSGASDAGIQEKDIVESLDGTPYESADALRAALGALYPGDRVTLAVRRGEERLELTAELRDRWQLFVGDRAELMVNGPTNGRSSGFEQALQHDTVLETNQCGGPVVDSEGRIIGMNIARAGRVASYALPAALVQRDVQAMIGETLDTQPTADRAGPTIASQDAAETVPTPAAQ